jgi:hypothetical protein
LFFLFSLLLFRARAFSFAISMTFPVFGAHPRPVNRLHFYFGFPAARSTSCPASIATGGTSATCDLVGRQQVATDESG